MGRTDTGGEDSESSRIYAAQVLEFATRLLSRSHPHDPFGGEVTLLIGEMPGELKPHVPLPPGCRLLGSQVYPNNVIVVLDTELPRERVGTFYDEALLNSGWTKPDPIDPFPEGGFAHFSLHEDWLPLLYCQGPKEPYLSVNAASRQEGMTEVRLQYIREPQHSPCDPKQRSRMRPFFNEESFIIPRLSAPPAGLQTPKGGQGHVQNYFAESIAYLKTDLPTGSVHTHYNAQLEKSGWREIESGEDEGRAWSKFAFEDKEEQKWWGLLLITAFPTQWGEYLLYVLARHEEAQEDFDEFLKRGGFGGWGYLPMS